MSDGEMSPVTVAYERSFRRILKAEWAGAARAGADYFCCQLDCGHHTHVSEGALRSPVLCMTCFKEIIAVPEVSQS